MGRPIRSARSRDLLDLLRPVEGLAEVLEALQEPPRGGDVDQSPLDDLAAAQSGPGALGFTLCRRVGQSAAPMASECSGLSAGARGKHVHSDLKADRHAVSQRTRQKCSVTASDGFRFGPNSDGHDWLDLWTGPPIAATSALVEAATAGA